MSKPLFPAEMLESKSLLNLDIIKSKLNYYELQAHELHWQTFGGFQHLALGELYEFIFTTKDEIVEKIMGYTGVRTKAMKMENIENFSDEFLNRFILDLQSFSKKLEDFGEQNNMPDIENIAQGFSGKIAHIRYKLTLK